MANPIAEALMYEGRHFVAYPEMCSECPGLPACAAHDCHEAKATTALEFMVNKSQEAIRDGLQLDEWYRKRRHSLNLVPIDLHHAYDLPNRAEAFYDSVEINGKARSVMGCQQEVQLGRITAGDAPALVRDFVLREFMNRAHWLKPDGTLGGFTIRKCFYKTTEGVCSRFEPEERDGCIDWRSLGNKYEWVLMSMYLHDFVMDFGPYHKHLKEALGFVTHPSFVHVVENPSVNDLLEVTIGYSVAGYAPIPNDFGFGPGKFDGAIKGYTFLLNRQNEVRVNMMFAAAPRCQKVFDFGKYVPDPVYGGAELLSHLSFGLWQPDHFHDKLDKFMLAQHCRVHQALMDGVSRVFANWVAEAARQPATA